MAQHFMEQSMPPEVEVLFGTPRQELTGLVVSSVETRLAANQIANARIVLRQPGGADGSLKTFAADAARCQPGTAVTIRIRNGAMLFKGLVAEQSCSHEQGFSELTLRLSHPLQGAVSSHGSRVFAQMSEEAVLRQLLQSYAIRLTQANDLPAQRHAQLVQYECSDWQFIRTRLHANGVWLWPDSEGNVSVAAPALSEPRHTLLEGMAVVQEGRGNIPLIESMTWSFRNRELTHSVGVSSWNPSQQKMETRQANSTMLGSGGLAPSRLKRLGPERQEFNASLPLPQGERQAWANSRLLAMQAASIQGSVTVIGSTAYRLGETVGLSGFGNGFDGAGIISSVEQRLSAGRWRTVVTIGQESMAGADASLVPSVPGLHTGVVAAYQDDPENMDRLRVQVPLLGAELWARFAAPYASNNSAVCFYPEPGDEVVLGFFGADPRYPVILGAVHNPRNPSPFSMTEAGRSKGVILRQGDHEQQLLFDTQSGSVLLQSGQDQLVLQEGIDMASGKTMNLQGKDIKFKADASLAAAGRQVEIKGSKINLVS
jgi:type VI secretion system secreted protein VgrG